MRNEFLGLLISLVIALWLTLSIYGSGLSAVGALAEWRVPDVLAAALAVALILKEVWFNKGNGYFEMEATHA